jgi:hypothetical protein
VPLDRSRRCGSVCQPHGGDKSAQSHVDLGLLSSRGERSHRWSALTQPAADEPRDQGTSPRRGSEELRDGETKQSDEQADTAAGFISNYAPERPGAAVKPTLGPSKFLGPSGPLGFL